MRIIVVPANIYGVRLPATVPPRTRYFEDATGASSFAVPKWFYRCKARCGGVRRIHRGNVCLHGCQPRQPENYVLTNPNGAAVSNVTCPFRCRSPTVMAIASRQHSSQPCLQPSTKAPSSSGVRHQISDVSFSEVNAGLVYVVVKDMTGQTSTSRDWRTAWRRRRCSPPEQMRFGAKPSDARRRAWIELLSRRNASPSVPAICCGAVNADDYHPFWSSMSCGALSGKRAQP